MTDVPYGVLLSGGLDSSVISAITKKFYSRNVLKIDEQSQARWPTLHSFAVSLADAPDHKKQLKIVTKDAIGTVHHELTSIPSKKV